MKISEAIRQGVEVAKKHKITQATHVVFNINTEGEICKACAFGYAMLGAKGYEVCKELSREVNANYDILNDTFGLDLDANNACLGESPLWFVIHRNDADRCTPEEIANGLEACGL